MPVVQRQRPGRDSTDNCGGSAVAVLLGRPFLGQGRRHARCRAVLRQNGRCSCCAVRLGSAGASTVMTPPWSCASSAQLHTWRIDSALGSEFKSCPPVAAHPS